MANTDKIIEELSDSLQPVEKISCPYKLFFKGMFLTFLYMAVILAVSGFREDIALKLVSPLFIAEIAMLMVIIISGLLTAFFLSFPDICQKKSILLLPFLSFLIFTAILFFEYINDNSESAEIKHGIECIFYIGMVSFAPALLMFRAIRKHAPTYCCVAGLVTLLTSTAIGALVLRLSEKMDSITHIIAWHYLPLIGFAVIGMVIGKKILKW